MWDFRRFMPYSATDVKASILLSALGHVLLCLFARSWIIEKSPLDWALQPVAIFVDPAYYSGSKGNRVSKGNVRSGKSTGLHALAGTQKQSGEPASARLLLNDMLQWGNKPPDYPSEAIRRGWQGDLMLRIVFNTEGGVGALELVESSGYGVLDDEALRAARAWRLPAEMANRGGGAVYLVPLEFRIL